MVLEQLPKKKLLAGGGFAGVAALIYYINQSGTETDAQPSGQSNATNWAQGSSGPISAGAIQGSQGGGTEGLVRNRIENDNAEDDSSSGDSGSDEYVGDGSDEKSDSSTLEYVGESTDTKAEIVQKHKDQLPSDRVFTASVETDSEGNTYNPAKYAWIKENILPSGFTPGDGGSGGGDDGSTGSDESPDIGVVDINVEITEASVSGDGGILVIGKATNNGSTAGEVHLQAKVPGRGFDTGVPVIKTLDPGESVSIRFSTLDSNKPSAGKHEVSVLAKGHDKATKTVNVEEKGEDEEELTIGVPEPPDTSPSPSIEPPSDDGGGSDEYVGDGYNTDLIGKSWDGYTIPSVGPGWVKVRAGGMYDNSAPQVRLSIPSDKQTLENVKSTFSASGKI